MRLFQRTVLAISNNEICFALGKSLFQLSFALSVQGVVNHKFALENFVIAQTELAKAMRDPAQTFSGGMRIVWLRIGRAHNFAQQNKRRIVPIMIRLVPEVNRTSLRPYFFKIELNDTSW